MLRIAGQTAGPIGLKFFCGYLWVAEGVKGEIKFEIFPRTKSVHPASI